MNGDKSTASTYALTSNRMGDREVSFAEAIKWAQVNRAIEIIRI